MEAIAASALVGASGGLSGYTTYRQARDAQKQQTGYQRLVHQRERQQARTQMTQAQRAAAAARRQRQVEASLIRSTIRAAAGEAGVGFGGTYEALMRQASLDEAANLERIGANLFHQIQAIRSGGAIFQQAPDTAWLQGLTAGVQGAAAGLQIVSGVQGLQRPLGGATTAAPAAAAPTGGWFDFQGPFAS